jgi:hypothetical protein
MNAQPQPFTGYGTGGVYHYAPAPLPPVNPPEQGWSFRVTGRIMRERRAPSMNGHAVALLPRTGIQSVKSAALSERALWKEIQSFPAFSVREYILRAIAGDENGSGYGAHLSKRDADSQVFGSTLSKEERHRNYLRTDGIPFDQWIDSAMSEYAPDSDAWNANALRSLHAEFSDTLSDIVMRVSSSKEARTILIDEYRKAQQRKISDFEPAF